MLTNFAYFTANNLCFHGKCGYYCDTAHAICGRPDTIEGSFAAFLPSKTLAPRKASPFSWTTLKTTSRFLTSFNFYFLNRCGGIPTAGRTTSGAKRPGRPTRTTVINTSATRRPTTRAAAWPTSLTWPCWTFWSATWTATTTRPSRPSATTPSLSTWTTAEGRWWWWWSQRRLIDKLILICPFLCSFGKAGHDEQSILAPLVQCCIIRDSTLQRLIELHNNNGGNGSLAERMRASMDGDPVAPILPEPHLLALNRRLGTVLGAVRECTKRRPFQDVIVIDGFWWWWWKIMSICENYYYLPTCHTNSHLTTFFCFLANKVHTTSSAKRSSSSSSLSLSSAHFLFFYHKHTYGCTHLHPVNLLVKHTHCFNCLFLYKSGNEMNNKLI